MLQWKYPFPKTVANACRILARWLNRYSIRDTRTTEANDGIEFVTISKEYNKGNKKKEVTCYKSEKVGHVSNECGKDNTVRKSNKKRSNFLVVVCLIDIKVVQKSPVV